MFRVGGVAAATRMTNDDNEVKNIRGPGGSQLAQVPDNEDENTHQAQRIVKELYQRYQKQLNRWRDYKSLFIFLSFVALFLAVLYTQRQANTAYKVHATLDSVLVPKDDTMSSTGDVYAWLKGILSTVWVDPKCGDGICESPFEFASYSRFGCRADCGKLQEVQKLTKVQLDVYFDFNHPVGSMPAADLMQQTTYNLCPVQTAFSGGCYYDNDQAFDRLSGSQTATIDDMPDGQWDLIMRRDIFMKTSGAVRDYNLLNAVSYYYRVYIAALSAIAEQNTEVNLLTQAVVNGSMSLMDFIAASLPSSAVRANATEVPFYIQQFKNATCGCLGVPVVNQTFSWNDTNILEAFNNSNYGDTNWATYSVNNCTSQQLSSPEFYDYQGANSTVRTIRQIDNANATDVQQFCFRTLSNLTTWRDAFTNNTRRLMVDMRLDTRFGKVAARNLVFNALRSYIINKQPELFDHVFTYPVGQLAATDMTSSRVDVLQEYFVSGTTYFAQPAPAFLNASRRFIYVTNATQQSMTQRAVARLIEVRMQQVETLNIRIPANTKYAAYKFPDGITVQQLIQAFNAASGNLNSASEQCNTTRLGGCTWVNLTDGATFLYLPNNTLPQASNPALNSTAVSVDGTSGIATDYNLVSWQGNNTAYLMCNLDTRGPQYIGTCTDMPIACTSQNNDTVPYICTDYASGTNITGSLSDLTYRTTCELPCDMRADCNAVCECYGACSSTQMCVCKTCQDMNQIAASEDEEFQSIAQFANASSQATIVAIPKSQRRRGLRQTVDATLTTVLNQLGNVSTAQTSIQLQMQALQQQVTRANQLADARASDQTLLNLIKTTREDIKSGQAAVEAKLDEIIGKQQQALNTANSALQALNAIQGLAQKQLAALQSLEKVVQTQLTAIKSATLSGGISLTQALGLWKRARRDRATTLKAASLSNIPCNSLPYQDNNFGLDNGNNVDMTAARERNVGLTNRVIGGMLLHQFRTDDANCSDSKFAKIQQTCTGGTTIKSYGVDPIFKMGTTMYDPDLDDFAGKLVVGYYNCTVLGSATYDITFQNTSTNALPYCAELYNPQNLPYAFHHFPLDNKEEGFPVFFDINLSAEGAASWETYLEEGLYLDQHTRGLTAELVTYNAPLRIFGYFRVNFFFSDGGSIKITHRLHTVRVELYNGYDDRVRYAFEVILSMWIYGMLLYTVYQMYQTHKEKGHFVKFFASGWNWVDLISNLLLATTMSIWWVFVVRYANTFDISLRHDVYKSLTPDANYLALNQNGLQLRAEWEDVQRLRDLVDMLNWYFALNGINILLLIARVLRLMDFQPRLGVVTRSLWLAGPDLIHFAIVAGIVFIGYAMMAHLIFGNAIEKFQTFGDSVNTCFEILLGNIDVNTDLRALGGLQSVAGALFFWSYELLVFMVLLNFLLAIIVDAFAEVKEKTHETVGIHTELWQLMRDKWRSVMGVFSSDYISDARLGLLLKQWAGDDKDDDAAAAQAAEVQKILTILNEDLDEEDLRNVLLECLRDIPQAGTDADEDAKKKAAGLLKFLPRSRALSATPQEVTLAAKYIIDRFGVPLEAEEELLEDDQEDQDGQGPRPAQAPDSAAPPTPGVAGKERDQLASALERLAEVQRELAEGQRNLMQGQKQLAEQQSKLVGLISSDNQ